MDNTPPLNLDNPPPDPILDRNKSDGNVNVPGRGKKYLSIFIGLFVALVLVVLLLVAIYLMRGSMPEVIQDLIPDDVQIPYRNAS